MTAGSAQCAQCSSRAAGLAGAICTEALARMRGKTLERTAAVVTDRGDWG